MPKIFLKQIGQPVADFSFTGAVVTVGGIVVDCVERQQNSSVVVEIRLGPNGAQEGGSGAYLAHIEIPPTRFVSVAGPNDAQGNPTSIQQTVPLEPNAVQVTLWPTA